MKHIVIAKHRLPLRLPKSNPKIVVGVHPAWICRGKQVFAPIFTKQVMRGLKSSFTRDIQRPPFTFVLDIPPQDLHAYLMGVSAFAFDVETPRSDHKHITMCSFSAYPWHSVVAPWTPDIITIARYHLERRDTTKIAHNADFDVTAMEAYDINIPKATVWCTATGANVLEPDYPVALHAVCSLHMDNFLYWKELGDDPQQQALWQKALGFDDSVNWEQIYCGLDSAHTFMLQRWQNAGLVARNQVHTFADQMEAFQPLRGMQQRGLKVDEIRRSVFLRRALREKEGYEREIATLVQDPYRKRRRAVEESLEAAVATRSTALTEKKAGDTTAVVRHRAAQAAVTRERSKLKRISTGFKVDSDLDWRWLLFSHYKIPHIIETNGGTPSVNKEALQELRDPSTRLRISEEQLGVLDILEKTSSLTNQISTFIEVDVDNESVAHPGYQLFKTATSRLASGAETVDRDKPAHSLAYNAQNIPQSLRRMYRPHHARNFLLEVDWEQIELRRMAWRLGIKSLIDALRRGVDVHQENAAVIFQVVAAAITSNQRTHAKRFTHGVDYGAGARKIGRVFRISEKHARD